MEERDWTSEQRSVFEDRGHNLLVSASAGSGKTTVMTKRIVDLIADENVPISKFLIVTFTKASAADMKKKIIDELSKREQTPFIIEQIDGVDTADISDLHSFYSRLISTYFYEAEIDPNFSVIDEAQSSYLKNKAIEKLFEDKEKKGDAAYFELTDMFQKSRTNRELKEKIFGLNAYLDSFAESEEWFKEKLELSYNTNIEENECAKLINNYICLRAKKLSDKAFKFAEKCLSFGVEKYYEFFNEISSNLKTIKTGNNFMANAKIVFEFTFNKRPTIKGDEFKFLAEEADSFLKKIKKEIENFKNNFVDLSEGNLATGLLVAKNDLITLYNFTKEFEKYYAEIKSDIGGLDFGDLEKFAYKILQNTEIAEAVRSKFKYVFVDEYQDINGIQEKIISIISSSNNRFMVGDIKQSIYRFRLCDPEIFLNKYHEYSGENSISKLFKLNANFRSDKKILKFVDKVFSGVMTENFGDIDYAKDSKFIAGKNNLDEPNSANLCFIDTTKSSEEKEILKGIYSVKNHQQEDENEIKIIEAEARLVADKISKLAEEKKDDFKFGDVAVLVFKRGKKISRFINALASFGVPISADEKYDIMQKNYVQEIMNFAKLTLHSNDDFLLLKVLKSKLFNFTDAELASLRTLDGCLRFFDLLSLAKNIENANLAAKTQNFCNLVEYYRGFAGTLKIKELIKKIISDFKIQELNLLSAEGDKICAEIDKFIQTLPEKNAYEFLTQMDDYSLIYENEGGENSVKLMTIHKSKGMEFKYVFLVDIAGKINFESARGDMLFSKDYGIGLSFFDREKRVKFKSLANSAISLLEANKIAEEQQRVLYVAMTRAIEKLYVICSTKKDGLMEEFPERPRTYSAWFERLIASGLEGKIDEFINFEEYSLNELSFEPKVEDEPLLLSPEKVKEEKEFEYSFNSSSKVPLKNSISKILLKKQDALDEDFDDEFEKQELRLSDDLIKSYAERGTAYHKVFEKLDLKDLKNIDEQLAKIKSQFDAEMWKHIEESKIKNVLLKDFFLKIEDSDKIFKEKEFFASVPASIAGGSDDDEIILQGVIDLIVIKENGLFVLDYKTGSFSSEKLEKYSFQLNSYAEIAARAFNMPVLGRIICFIDEQKLVEI